MENKTNNIFDLIKGLIGSSLHFVDSFPQKIQSPAKFVILLLWIWILAMAFGVVSDFIFTDPSSNKVVFRDCIDWDSSSNYCNQYSDDADIYSWPTAFRNDISSSTNITIISAFIILVYFSISKLKAMWNKK